AFDPMPPLQRTATELRNAFAEHGTDLRATLDAAIAGKVLNGNSYRAELPDALWRSMQAWCDGDDATGEIDPRIDRLTPAKLAEKTNKGQHACTPASPLCDAIAAFVDASGVREQWLTGRSIDLLHRLRNDASRRLAQLKHTRRLQTYDDLIDGVADAIDGEHGDALVASLRAQYAIALVDEFQDTDARQWAIFQRVFGRGDAGAQEDVPAAAPALFLIGDPKQAIYGFRGGDVHTYLAAKRDAAIAPPLAHNFRSRPGLLRAIEALYTQAGDGAFVDDRIAFHQVEPGAGNDDADYQRNGAPAPALTLRALPAAADGKPRKADDSRALATEACVAEIHAVLADARIGRATIAGKPVRPGDVAVLVRSHAEATRMQSALVAGGIPAVAAGKQSLFETEQAKELLAVFDALLQPADEGRLRAALATVLLGIDGAGIARLDVDDAWRRDCQLDALQWRERWQRHGPLALVADLCARHAERLLGLVDGERRLTNLLQLGELLQEADARALGLHGLVDGLRTRIAEADPNDEQQLLRLESDAHRVQILTLHKSKGLEFPLVFLPFVGIGRKDDKPSRHCQVPGDEGRVLHWKVGKDDASERWQHAVMAWEHEQRAEDARLLYVGLTRAEHALWLATGSFYNAGSTALAAMVAAPDALRAHADIVLDDRPRPGVLLPLPPESARAVPEARHARRTLSRDWWVYSFTQLTNEATGIESAPQTPRGDGIERGADDESEPLVAPIETTGTVVDPRFAGSRFGNVLHMALEHVDFAAWREWRDGAPSPPGQDAPLRAALRGEGYAETDLDDGVAQLTPLVGQTLTVTLPEGARLCDVPPDARRAEMEFHFAMQPTSVDAMLATLHAHGVLRDRHAFGLRRTLEGLMTGKIDLVYMHGGVGHGDGGPAGRYYLLDYKSNRLPAYDAASIARAMDESEYTLQALIYTLALHRWLRFRLGDGYDYARDFGGVRYVFCRGLDAAGAPDSEIYA
ncbi:MAG: 3'-5' exonuclease, partial [Lysobacter sp.]